MGHDECRAIADYHHISNFAEHLPSRNNERICWCVELISECHVVFVGLMLDLGIVNNIECVQVYSSYEQGGPERRIRKRQWLLPLLPVTQDLVWSR